MRFSSIFLLVLSISLACFQPVIAQSAPPLVITNHDVAYEFGIQITFLAQLSPADASSQAAILIQTETDSQPRSFPIQMDSNGNTRFEYNPTSEMLRPFSTLNYQYSLRLENGQQLTTERFSFQYLDNRFTWQVIDAGDFRLHWYAGGPEFGEQLSDVSRRAANKARELFAFQQSAPIDIYVYSSSSDQAGALETANLQILGGHASPELRVIFATIPPGPEQGLEMDQKIPHELAHVFIYDIAGPGYSQLPVWLREGLASLAELSPNPDYPAALSNASSQQTLIRIQDLCAAFPVQYQQSRLAYAESESFSRFLLGKFGQPGLLTLIKAYADGLDCENGAQQALGQSLATLEDEWRKTILGINPGLAALKNILPYLVVLLIFVIVIIASAFAPRRSQHV